MHRLIHFKKPVRACAARMHDALWNPLVVEVHDFFTQDVIFEQRRATGAAAQRILVVADAQTLIGGERFTRLLRVYCGGLFGTVGV